MSSYFNIYYVNNEKASEISLLFDNTIIEKILRIKNHDIALSGDSGLSTTGLSKIPVFGQYIPSAELSGSLSHNRSSRVEDTIKVVSSKSTILRPLVEKATEIPDLNKCNPGKLVMIKDLSLTVVNFDDVLAIKALLSGLLTQVPVDGLGNMNFTSLMEVLFKDAAYILNGKIRKPNDNVDEQQIMLKIPMSIENEMESQYSISDLEIGKVTVIGIYRGELDKIVVESKINRLMSPKGEERQTSQPNITKRDRGIDIEDGIFEQEKQESDESSSKVYYIDVIAIIQEIEI